MLREDGYVKVLDFGLAKLLQQEAPNPEASTLVKTADGVVMGTISYMSPEQARVLKSTPERTFESRRSDL